MANTLGRGILKALWAVIWYITKLSLRLTLAVAKITIKASLDIVVAIVTVLILDQMTLAIRRL